MSEEWPLGGLQGGSVWGGQVAGAFFEYSLVYFRFCGLNLFYLLKKINCTIYVRKAAVEKKTKTTMVQMKASAQVLREGGGV